MDRKFLKSASAKRLESEEVLSLGLCRVKEGKYYEFMASLDGELSEGGVIFACHGHMMSYGRWLEITDREIKVCNFTSWANPQLTERVYEHGLTIKNFIKIYIAKDTEHSQSKIIVTTDGAEYSMGAGHWSSCDGEITMYAKGLALNDVSVGFTANGYAHDIWVIGASYLSLGDPARWPFYWFADEGAGPLLTGRGGMGAQNGMEDFLDSLKYGTPKILVWDSVTGNNPDTEDALSPVFYEHTLEMLKICKEKGIKVYIQTMPNCPVRTNIFKNDMIINHTEEFANYDYEVIDLARSLNARDEKHPSWFPLMLHTDNVHPTRLGGRASYLGIVCDAPELIVGKACKVYSSEDNKLVTLKSGESIALTCTEDLKQKKAITFRADFDGALSGKIKIGNEKGTSLVIDKDNLAVYSYADDKEKLVFKAENPVITEKLINVKIQANGNEATIELTSAGDRNYDPARTVMQKFTVEWAFTDKFFAEADGVDLTDARIKFVTAD